MKASLKTFFCLMFLGALAACTSKSDDKSSSSGEGFYKADKGKFLAKVDWPTELKAGQGQDNKAVVTFQTPEGQAPGTVAFTGFHPSMPAHGHPTSEDTQKITARTDTPNVFDVTGIMFIMGGEATTWVTKIVATVNDNADEVTIPISRDVND